MLEIVHLLTSSTKREIFEMVERPATPDSIASALGITRQAVDKHLKEFVKYGLVRRMWLLSSARPRLEYSSTPLGSYFYSRIEEFMSSYRDRGNMEFRETMKSIDFKLINGEISKSEYSLLREEKMKDWNWFLQQQ